MTSAAATMAYLAETHGKSSSPVSRSCRIFAAATTHSPPKPHVTFESPPHSPNSPKRSDTSVDKRHQAVHRSSNATGPLPLCSRAMTSLLYVDRQNMLGWW